jgi:hypothetical protein
VTHGIEPLLVAAKFPDPEEQLHIIANLQSFDAWAYGRKQVWQDDQTLYWMGEGMNRHSLEYTTFVCEMYHDLYDQNMEARGALISTGDGVLKHSIGGTDPHWTVLTRNVFCHILTNIRAYYRSLSYVEY